MADPIEPGAQGIALGSFAPRTSARAPHPTEGPCKSEPGLAENERD
jgi:hypothetical protein